MNPETVAILDGPAACAERRFHGRNEMTFEITCKNSGRASYGEHVSFGRELLKEPDNVDVSISSRTDAMVGRIRQFQVGKRYEVTVSQVGLMKAVEKLLSAAERIYDREHADDDPRIKDVRALSKTARDVAELMEVRG